MSPAAICERPAFWTQTNSTSGVLHDPPFGLSKRPEPLAGEAMGQHGHEHIDPRVAEEVERLGNVALDRLL